MEKYYRILILILPFLTGYPIVCAEKVNTLIENIPAQWEYESEYILSYPSEDKWWKIFQDPLLDSLIYEGENHNFNLKQALNRIEVARNTVKKTRATLFPQLNLDLGWSKNRTSGLTSSMASPLNTSYFSGVVSMNWEIDVFGKLSAQIREEKENFNASRADYASVCISLCAEIASDYIMLRTLQEELKVIEEHIQSQEKVLKITEARYEAGLASMLDVSQAKTDYYTMQSSLSSIQTQIATTINAIAVLIGEYPGNLMPRLSTSTTIQFPGYTVNVGIPSDLLRRRPDVVEAEYSLAAAAAALGVAKKDFLPTLSLSGSLGTETMNFKDLFTSNSFTYSLAPSLSWTIFDGLEREANIAMAKEQMMIALEDYNATVLTAVEEVDNAIFTYLQALKYEKEIGKVVESATLTFSLALDRYKQGLDAFINVADAQMTVLQYSNELVEAKGSALTALISLYKAVGGGWNVSDLQ